MKNVFRDFGLANPVERLEKAERAHELRLIVPRKYWSVETGTNAVDAPAKDLSDIIHRRLDCFSRPQVSRLTIAIRDELRQSTE